MAKRLAGNLALLMLGVNPLAAQEFPPGYVDPAPLLAAVAEEIGEADLRCITFSGSGYAGAVGQTFENAVNSLWWNPGERRERGGARLTRRVREEYRVYFDRNATQNGAKRSGSAGMDRRSNAAWVSSPAVSIDWPRIDALANYTRVVNREAGTSVETFDRQPGMAPASWKYGLGWRGGTPTQKETRQTHVTAGEFSWHLDGDGPPVAVPPEIAEVYQLDMWLNPHGFVKASRLPGANPVAFWRWEQIEKGRDGNVVSPKKMHVVAITMFGKYRVDATINSRNQIQRLKTTVNIPALGDFNIEHESTNHLSFGNIKWPTDWHSHQGWDDNWQFYRHSTGHNAYGGTFTDIRPNECGDAVPVPESVAEADWSTEVTVDEIADGVYRLGGGPANSYLVEFSDFVAVFEAPGDEDRSLKVIDRITKLAPDKPIRWVIASHPHFDHIGGLRTYLHIGSTIVTHMLNLEFLNHDVLTYEPRTIKPDIVSRWPPTELAEGYNYEAIQENYVITDDSRILRVYYVQPLPHVAGMLMAYLPAERIAFQADLFDTHEPPQKAQLPSMRALQTQVERMHLDVETLAPVHGEPVPWSDFLAALEQLEP